MHTIQDYEANTMTGSKQLAFALSIFCGMFALAYAQQNPIETRGELLYSTHCAACHTSEIHWREKKLATDLDSLKFQVRRWQASIGLNWTEDEITDVVSYLNAAYYGFQDADQKGFLEGIKPLQALHKD
jgi:mono/diheme cytochrome c family protein